MSVSDEKQPNIDHNSNLLELMSTIERILFDSSDPIVVALTGSWGAGKSHFWKQKILENRPEESAGYVSVFGADNLHEIRERVVFESLRKPRWEEKKWTLWLSQKFAGLNQKWLCLETKYSDSSIVWRCANNCKNILESFFKKLLMRWPEYLRIFLSPSSMATRLIEEAAMKPGWVLCIDDIERLSTTIGIDTLLGYICELRDERKIKVLLIYNDDILTPSVKIGKNETDHDSTSPEIKKFLDFKEKVIDRELPFLPDMRDAVRLVFSDAEFFSNRAAILEHLEACCSLLALDNIRLLMRARHFYNELTKVLPEDIDDEFLKECISSLLLFIWVKNTRKNEYELTLKLFENYDSWSYYFAFDKGKEDGDNVKQKLIENFLHRYNYQSSSKLTKVLLRFVDSNILDTAALTELHTERKESIKLARLGEKFSLVWKRLYHGTFRDTSDEFCMELENATRDYLNFIPLVNFSPVLEVLNKLGKEDAAKRLLDEFYQSHKDSLSEYAESAFFDEISNDELKGLILEAVEESKVDGRSISEAYGSAIESRFVSNEDVSRINEFSEDEIFDYLTAEDSESLTTNLRYLCGEIEKRSQQNDTAKSLANKMKVVVRRVANMSAINKLRMESMGLLKDGCECQAE